MVTSSLAVIFYFGGYHLPGITPAEVAAYMQNHFGAGTLASVLTSLVFLLVFCAKVAIFLWIFIWVRWTLPRFRYDQLMDLGWKSMLPWAIFNTIITAAFLVYLRGS